MVKFISKSTFYHSISLLTTAFLISCIHSKPEIRGELKKWHRVTLVFNGPETSEMDENNPFLNYRMEVTFSHADTSFVVPGFYAADGNSAESSADSGNKWMVHFTPNKSGDWRYSVSFLKGENIAIAEDISQAKSAGFFDRVTGNLTIVDSDKIVIDNRAKGRLNYVGEHYLKFEETGKYFIKTGVDAPENFLGYTDFDASSNVFNHRKTWEPHKKDFQENAKSYLWKGEKGRNLLGAIHYLASEGLNVFSFLTFNIDGDDRNVYPYLLKVSTEEYENYANGKKNLHSWDSLFYHTRFDVSKLEQWERIFEYAETQGMFLHFKTHETETDHLMDGGVFGKEGKLYYRELIARFGHHLAMNWNLGEENNQPIPEVIQVANYIHQLDPYKHHMVIHTFPNKDDRYAELIGDQSPLTGASLQLSDPEFKDVHPRVLKWRAKSDSTSRQWALAVDEPGSARFALLPDDEDPEHYFARSNALWGTLMAGGYGVEWYFGYASPNSDLTCQDFRSRDLFWNQNLYARQFFETYLPFWKMEPADELVSGNESFCLTEKGIVYAIYRPPGINPVSLNLSGEEGEFNIKWFDPRHGGELQLGTIIRAKGGEVVEIGDPPSNVDKDWVILIIKTN